VSRLLQNLADLHEAFAAAGADRVSHRGTLQAVRDYATRYAHLEKLVLGAVSLPVPVHLFEEGASLPEDPLAAAEIVAGRERRRLALGDREAGDVMRLLDRESLKVYRTGFPEDSPIEGFFLFDPDAGPLLVANAALAPLEADFLFARLYAHYLFDNDPYRIRIAAGGPNGYEASIRAIAFASAFLVSRDGLSGYLEAAGWREGAPLSPGLLEQLALYFEVAYRTLLARLLSLGLLEASEVPPLLDALRDARDPELSQRGTSAVPERFTRLALEAHARGALTLNALALYLETDARSAKALAARFDMGSNESPG
jgi:Zn-dependent peptidase ImmA (M78 family)